MNECKILIVDDDLDDIEILLKAFKDNGISCTHYELTATNALTYLEKLNEEQLPKVIITDSILTGMTGVEFLTKLNTIVLYKDIRVVVISGSISAKEIEKYRQLGAIDFIQKPYDFDGYRKVAADIKSKVDL